MANATASAYLLILVTARKASQTSAQPLEKISSMADLMPCAIKGLFGAVSPLRGSPCVFTSKAVETIQPQDGGRLSEGG